ncbi:MAG: glutathione S-transferase family protein [Sphingomonadales bacterium]
MELYGARLSPYYERVYLQIQLKDLAGKITCPEVPGGDWKSPEYLAINPLGKIPALKDGDFCLPESSIICEYLEDKFPERPLLPADAQARARTRLIMRLVDLELLSNLFILFGQLSAKEKDEALIKEKLAAITTGLDLIEDIAGGGDFLVGEDWTLADCALHGAFFFMTRLLPQFGADPLDNRPKLAAWHAAALKTDLIKEAEEARQQALNEFLAKRAAEGQAVH